MRTIKLLLTISMFYILIFGYEVQLFSQNNRFDYIQIPYVKGECLIEFKDSFQIGGISALNIKQKSILSAINNKYRIDRTEEVISHQPEGFNFRRAFEIRNIYKVKFLNKEIDIINIIPELKSIVGIAKVEPNYIFKVFETIPNEYANREGDYI